MDDRPELSAASAVERHECPRCGATAGSPCRTRGGGTAFRYHTQRFILVPELNDAVEVLVPVDRGPGRPWRPAAGSAPAAAAESAFAAKPYRIGYAYCSPASLEGLTSQLDALDAAQCDRVFGELVSPAMKRRPQLDSALRLARELSRSPLGRPVVLTVAELRRLARNSAELMALSGTFRDTGIRLELLDGPLAGVHDPQGAGSILFEVLTASAELDRDHLRDKSLEGREAAAAQGRRSGRPKVFDEEMLALARILRDRGMPVPDIAAELIIRTGKSAGRHPSVASVYRALAEAEAEAAEESSVNS